MDSGPLLGRAFFDKDLASPIGMLRAGYPEGVPDHDYVALLAVLRHTLTDTEIRHVVAELTRDRNTLDAIGEDEIEAIIASLALEEPSEKDVARATD